MTASDIVKELIKATNNTQSQLATLVGMKNQSNVSEALKRDMKVSVLTAFVEAMGYEVVIQKKKPGRRTEGQYVVEGVKKESSQ